MGTTIRDIARKAGVSVATVSRAMNSATREQVREETRKKVFEVIREYNYVPDQIARSLSTRKTKVLGLCIPFSISVFGSDYFTGIIMGATEAARKRGYELKIVSTLRSYSKGLDVSDLNRASAIDGAILAGTMIHDKMVEAYQRSDMPWILVNNYTKGKIKTSYVDCDNKQAAVKAVDYLTGLGHKKIGFINGSKDSRNANDRYDGYIKALKENGIGFEKKLVGSGNFIERGGYIAAKKLIKGNKTMTAIFCADDEMAFGTLQAIKDCNLKCPDDISVIGFDDIRLARYVNPALTTIHQPIYDIGKVAAQLLISIIEGKTKAPVAKIFRTRLVKRDSCAQASGEKK